MFDPHCLLMTQRLAFMGLQMAFKTIGFHAALILNRLRNEQQIAGQTQSDERSREERDREEQAVGADLERLNKRLDLLRSRVYRSREGVGVASG